MSFPAGDWTRGPFWASHEAKRTWSPRLALASRTWATAETLSVGTVRSSALLICSAEELCELSAWAGERGLQVSALGPETRSADSYASASPDFGEPGVRVALHRQGLGRAWHAAWQARDDVAIARLLEFPACCARFFAETWGTAGLRDTTSSMKTLDGPPEANILLRWAGVRAVPHLPCSGRCDESAALGAQMLGVLRGAGMVAEAELLRVVLSWPILWNARHGEMQARAPMFLMTAATDYTPETISRERAGQYEPEWAPSWEDNGFATPEAMRAAHACVLAAAEGARRVLDLGCGDGALAALFPVGVGVEGDLGRARRGLARHPGVEVLHGRIEDRDGRPLEGHDVLLMPGRLLEMAPADADHVRAGLRAASRVVAYTYGDWGDLPSLAVRAGLTLSGQIHQGGGAQAAVAEVSGASREARVS